MAQSTSNTLRILALGDSLTWGYYNQGMGRKPYSKFLEMLLKGTISRTIQIDNHGYNGWTSAEILKELPKILSVADNEKSPYQIAVVLAGTNDLPDCIPDAISSNLNAIYDHLTSKGIYTFLMTIPRYERDDHPSAKPYVAVRTKVNQFLREKYSDRLVDLETLIPNGATDSNGNSLWDDDLHFSPAGYLKMAELIHDVVKPKILDLGESN